MGVLQPALPVCDANHLRRDNALHWRGPLFFILVCSCLISCLLFVFVAALLSSQVCKSGLMHQDHPSQHLGMHVDVVSGTYAIERVCRGCMERRAAWPSI
jgi:hypothetical protein